MAKNCIFEKSQIGDFSQKNFLTRVKNVFVQKSPKSYKIKYMYLGNVFSLFSLISYFLKFCHFWSKKLKFWPKSNFFFFWGGAFLVKISQNKKLIKKVRKRSLDTHIKMALANFWWFLSKSNFFTLVKKILGEKSLYWCFLKNTLFSQKSNYLNIFLVKFPF